MSAFNHNKCSTDSSTLRNVVFSCVVCGNVGSLCMGCATKQWVCEHVVLRVSHVYHSVGIYTYYMILSEHCVQPACPHVTRSDIYETKSSEVIENSKMKICACCAAFDKPTHANYAVTFSYSHQHKPATNIDTRTRTCECVCVFRPRTT